MALRSVAKRQALLFGPLRQAAAAARAFATGEQQDVVVIGGGPGGYVAAIKASQLGMKVTCIEGRGSLGGTCLNVGCIPSKALLNSSHLFWEATKHFKGFGVNVEGVSFDWGQIQKQKDEAVTGLTKGIEGLFKKNKVTYAQGWGSIKGPNEVEVTLLDGGKETISAKNILIATGSEVTPLPGVPVDEERIVSSTGALSLTSVPKTMVVIGGGYIGLEMGSVYQRLGAEVTVVEYAANIVPTMDGEIRKLFQRSLTKQGMKFKLNTKVNSAKREGDQVVLEVEPSKGGDKETMAVDVVLVSAGRRPYVTGLGLDAVGLSVNERGQIEVDDHFRTKVPSIYAIGDCIPGPMLAHKAEEDGVAAVEIMAGKAGHVNYNTVPSIVYTHPEVASVGLSEEEAKAKGLNYKTGKFSFMANSRARAVNDTEGMVKFISDKDTDKILGAWIMGPNAGELIPECVLAMEYGACTEDIARACHGHPTLSEAIKEAALATVDKPIHM
jgi:dihydrolipoamide dehydrogenase